MIKKELRELINTETLNNIHDKVMVKMSELKKMRMHAISREIELKIQTRNREQCEIQISNTLHVIFTNNKCGIQDNDGKTVLEPIYDIINPKSDKNDAKNGLIRVMLIATSPRRRELWGYIDTNGRVIIPAVYPFLSKFTGNMAVVSQTGNETECALINKRGIVLTPFNFNRYEINPIYHVDKSGKQENYAIFQEKGIVYRIDTLGQKHFLRDYNEEDAKKKSPSYGSSNNSTSNSQGSVNNSPRYQEISTKLGYAKKTGDELGHKYAAIKSNVNNSERSVLMQCSFILGEMKALRKNLLEFHNKNISDFDSNLTSKFESIVHTLDNQISVYDYEINTFML